MVRFLLPLGALALVLGLAWFFSRNDPAEIPAAGPEITQSDSELPQPPAAQEKPTVSVVSPGLRQVVDSSPATASLEVRLLDASGTTLEGIQVELEIGARELESGTVLELAAASTESGAQRFDDLPADLPLVVRAGAGYPWSPSRVRIAPLIEEPGPLELVFDYAGLILLGRALDEGGVPLANQELRPNLVYRSEHRGGGTSWPPFDSDDSGHFIQRLAGGLGARTLGAASAADGDPLTRYWLELRTGKAPNQLATESMELPESLGFGVHDLGDLVLAPLPVLAEGRVVDSRGSPVAGANVMIFAPNGSSRWQFPSRSADTPMMLYIDAEQVVSAENGSFSIRGPAPALPFEVHAGHTDYLQSAPLPCTAGSRGLLVVLHRAGFIEGSFEDLSPVERLSIWTCLSEPGGEFSSTGDSVTNPSILSLSLTRGHRQSTWSPNLGREFGLTEAGRFWFGPLPPGVYSLRFRLRGAEESFLLVENLELLPGEIDRDPRLQGIELDAYLAAFELRIVDDAGRRLTEGYALVGRDGTYDSIVSLDAEPLVIRGPAFPLDVVIRAGGFAEELVEDIHGDHEVVLSRGWPIELRLPPAVEVPEPWRLRFHWREERVKMKRTEWMDPPTVYWFDPTGRAEVIAPRPGWLSVTLKAVREEGDNMSLHTLHLPSRDDRIEVLDVQGTQVIELPLSPEELDKLDR